jgi:hypothetical protein
MFIYVNQVDTAEEPLINAIYLLNALKEYLNTVQAKGRLQQCRARYESDSDLASFDHQHLPYKTMFKCPASLMNILLCRKCYFPDFDLPQDMIIDAAEGGNSGLRNRAQVSAANCNIANQKSTEREGSLLSSFLGQDLKKKEMHNVNAKIQRREQQLPSFAETAKRSPYEAYLKDCAHFVCPQCGPFKWASFCKCQFTDDITNSITLYELEQSPCSSVKQKTKVGRKATGAQLLIQFDKIIPKLVLHIWGKSDLHMKQLALQSLKPNQLMVVFDFGAMNSLKASEQLNQTIPVRMYTLNVMVSAFSHHSEYTVGTRTVKNG